jgi:uncharacterized protein (TIGR04141 family)
LDTENLSPAGQRQIEPCDLLTLRRDEGVFYHVKVSTLSAQLSHLFNQAVNPIQLLRLNPDTMDRLETLVRQHIAMDDANELMGAIRNQKFRVIFAIVTKKDPAQKSKNLPLFSRISLMRSIKALKLMTVPSNLMFVGDESISLATKKKRRKRCEA